MKFLKLTSWSLFFVRYSPVRRAHLPSRSSSPYFSPPRIITRSLFTSKLTLVVRGLFAESRNKYKKEKKYFKYKNNQTVNFSHKCAFPFRTVPFSLSLEIADRILIKDIIKAKWKKRNTIFNFPAFVHIHTHRLCCNTETVNPLVDLLLLIFDYIFFLIFFTQLSPNTFRVFIAILICFPKLLYCENIRRSKLFISPYFECAWM